jgi:hypothetical protein
MSTDHSKSIDFSHREAMCVVFGLMVVNVAIVSYVVGAELRSLRTEVSLLSLPTQNVLPTMAPLSSRQTPPLQIPTNQPITSDLLGILPHMIYTDFWDQSVYFANTTIHSTDIMLYMPMYGYVSLQNILQILVTSHTYKPECVGTECVYGIVQSDCTCACIGVDWVGDACDQNTCHGHGAWNNKTMTCICDDGFDPHFHCRIPQCKNNGIQTTDGCKCSGGFWGMFCEHSPVQCDTGCKGMCVDGTCICKNTQAGPNCVYDCSAEGIRAGQCFLLPVNTGYDTCAQANGTTVCYCGGGYEHTSVDTLTIKTAICQSCTMTADDMATCCAPGVNCETLETVCVSAECCSDRTTGDACVAAGCTWCTQSQQCIFAPQTVCGSGGSVSGFRARWFTTHVPCNTTGLYQDECSAALRSTYLAVYDYLLEQAGTPDAQYFLTARDYINSLPWQRRNITETSQLGQTFYLQSPTSTFCGPTNSTPTYIGIVREFTYSHSVILGAVCSSEQATRFLLRERPPCDTLADAGLILSFYLLGVHYCISAPTPDQVTMDAHTNADSTIHASAVLGVSLGTYFLSLVSSHAVCAAVAINNNTISSTDGAFAMHPSNQLVWGNFSTHIDLVILPVHVL